MKKKHFWIIIMMIAVLFFALAATYIILYLTSGHSPKEYKKPSVPVSFDTTDSVDSDEDSTLLKNPYHWDKLKETNEDIYAYLVVPSTKTNHTIELPIAQPGDAHDDSFYLSHNEKGQYEFAGCIYSEKINALDFSDPVTVLYGHNMLNGTMFAHLHDFEKNDYFEKNQLIYVYTPNRRLTYQIYSAYIYDDRHILESYDFNDKSIRMEYFQNTLNPPSDSANIREGVLLNADSKILTLSTCTNRTNTTRYLVNGVLIQDEVTD